MIIQKCLLGLYLALLTLSFAESPEAATKKKAKKPADDPAMTFTIVRQSYCSENCAEWISAEGRITPNTPAAFKKILKKVGDRKLPVFLHSGGGDVEAALKLGRMIRKKGLDTSVGITFYDGCREEREKCRTPKDKLVPRGIMWADSGLCFSACPLVLAGGNYRLSATDAKIGVHSVTSTYEKIRVRYQERYRIVKGKKKLIEKKIVSRKSLGTVTSHKMPKSPKKSLLAYFAEMGVKPQILDKMNSTPANEILLLSQVEQLDLGLITGVDSGRYLIDATLCKKLPAGHCPNPPLTQ